MKQSSTDLFQLIKSLSGPERGYFKKYTSMHIKGEQNNYMKLFETIDRQEEYDEKRIREKLGNEPMLRNFSVAKNYLYDLLLKSLDAFHSDIYSELRSNMGCIAVLHKKRLYSQSEKLIEKSIAMAEELEYFPFLFELLFLKVILKRRSDLFFNEHTEGDLKAIRKQAEGYINKYKNDFEYNLLYTKFMLKLNGFSQVRGKSEIKLLKEDTAHPLFKNEKTALTDFAKRTFYNVLTGFSYTIGDYKKATKYFDRMGPLIEKQHLQSKDDLRVQVGYLQNLGMCQILTKNFKAARTSIEKINLFAAGTKQLFNKTRAFEAANNLEFELVIATGDVTGGFNLIKNIKSVIKKEKKGYELFMEKDITCFVFALVYFLAEEYVSANKFLNRIINNSFNSGSDLPCVARILSLIVSFELKKHELIEYAVKSTYRFLLKKKKLFKVESIILEFISDKFPGINTNKELIQNYIELKTQLEKAFKDPNEKGFFSYFDILSWLESKIEKRSFAEVVREKAKPFV